MIFGTHSLPVLCRLQRCASCGVLFRCLSIIRLIDSPSRRKELSLYVVARACEAVFNSAVIRYCFLTFSFESVLTTHRGWIRPIPYGETILFALFCAVIMYSFVYEPENLPSGYVRWIFKFTGGDDHLLYKLREVLKIQKARGTA